MAFTNLPPNLQDMFYNLQDQINKLVTGPNQAMYTAEYAQSTAQGVQVIAYSAQSTAITAQSTASTALTTANTANTTANTALTNAASAATAAGNAQTTANTALSTANSASTAASNAQTSANSAATAASNAQTTANTAITNASTAYTAAKASLQPSASTIVNATNQMTAIATNGITVYSGSSSSSGARVVMNSLGLAGYDASNSPTFSISATTGAAVFSGSVTGATITGGTLNINGNAIINSSGLLTATNATITGTINATSGYFGTLTNGWSVSSTGLVGVGGGVISGGLISGSQINIPGVSPKFTVDSTGLLTATGATITGTVNATAGYFGTSTNGWSISSTGLVGVGSGTISGGNITGTTITGGSLNIGSGTFQVSSAGAITATSGTIGGWNIGSGSLYTGTLASPNQYLSAAGGGLLTGSWTIGTLATNSNLLVGGTTTSVGELYAQFGANNQVANAANCWISTTGQIRRVSPSSLRYKTDVTNLIDIPELNPISLYDLPVRAFRYKDEFLSELDDRYDTLIPGFIAEEVDSIYPQAVDYENGQIENWNHRTLIPAMLALIQEQNKRIKILEGK